MVATETVGLSGGIRIFWDLNDLKVETATVNRQIVNLVVTKGRF